VVLSTMARRHVARLPVVLPACSAESGSPARMLRFAVYAGDDADLKRRCGDGRLTEPLRHRRRWSAAGPLALAPVYVAAGFSHSLMLFA